MKPDYSIPKRQRRPAPTQKRCGICGEIKLISEFYIRRDRRNQVVSQCITCFNATRTVIRSRIRHSSHIRAVITAALLQHGPRTTRQLLCAVQEVCPDLAGHLSAQRIAQQCIRARKGGDVEIQGNTRDDGHIWTIPGDPRPWVRGAPLRRSVRDIGLDAENLAWMAEMQARRARRMECRV